MDLIGIRYGAEEETIFFSILGRGGDCYGIAVYEGYEGLNEKSNPPAMLGRIV